MPRMLGRTLADGIDPVAGDTLCVTRATESERRRNGYYWKFPILGVEPANIEILAGNTHQQIDRALIRSFREDEDGDTSDDWMFVETPEAVAKEKSLALFE